MRKINQLPFIERTVYSAFDDEIIYYAAIVDESFDHEFGTEQSYYFDICEDKSIFVNDVESISLSDEQYSLIENDLQTLSLDDFAPDDGL